MYKNVECPICLAHHNHAIEDTGHCPYCGVTTFYTRTKPVSFNSRGIRVARGLRIPPAIIEGSRLPLVRNTQLEN